VNGRRGFVIRLAIALVIAGLLIGAVVYVAVTNSQTVAPHSAAIVKLSHPHRDSN
jgi:hypothetical protein